MEYPKALYLAGQQLVVDDEDQEHAARESGYDDWHADAAKSEAPPEPEAPAQPQIDVDVLRETEARLQSWEQHLFAREGEIVAREEAVAAAEAALVEKQAAAAEPIEPPAEDPPELDRDALKAEAAALGINFASNIPTQKLADLVAAHKQ